MRNAIAAAAFVLGIAATSHQIVAQTGSTGSGSAANPVVMPVSEIKWIEVRPGQQTSVLWGDPRTGPYGRFNKFAAGFDDRPHYHTRDLRAVITAGTVIVQVLGGERRELTQGSYLLLPGRTPHTHSCTAATDCVLFVQQDGPNDSVPVETAR